MSSNHITDMTLASTESRHVPDNTEHLLDDTDIPKKNGSLSFKACVQCKKENSNPNFQYCTPCFQLRTENYKQSDGIQKMNVLKRKNHSQKPNSPNVDSHTPEVLDNTQNKCNICYLLPKNGIFNHGKIAHVYCCYPCAKKWWKKSNKCPVCNVKIKFVTKMIIGNVK